MADESDMKIVTTYILFSLLMFLLLDSVTDKPYAGIITIQLVGLLCQLHKGHVLTSLYKDDINDS